MTDVPAAEDFPAETEEQEKLKQKAKTCAYDCGKPLVDSHDNRLAEHGENWGWAAHRECDIEARLKVLEARVQYLFSKLPVDESKRVLRDTNLLTVDGSPQSPKTADGESK